MSSRGPLLLLIVTLLVAAAILAGGSRLARRVEVVAVERDRTAARKFSETLQQQLQRLETLYESHLRRICREAQSEEARDVRKSADWLIGVRQWSVIQRGERAANRHIILDGTQEGHLPEPCFTTPVVTGLPRPSVIISEEETVGSGETHGWIIRPGAPAFYWARRGANEAVVLLVDLNAVATAVDQWVAEWAKSEFAPVAVTGGPDQLIGCSGSVLANSGVVSKARPNFLQPIPARWGTWHLASWDRTQTLEHYDSAILVASGVASGLIALIAVGVFMQQNRAAKLAAQRVSFVNRVSHELRSPLTNIQLNLDLASDFIVEPEAIQRLDLIREESSRLGRLISNVLTFSQQEQERAVPITLQPTSPDQILKQLQEQFAAGFSRRNITVQPNYHCPDQCVIDRDGFSQIIANLLSNAEKYAANSALRIKSDYNDGLLCVRVSDEGPGIPAEEAQRIFLPFERLSSRVTEGVSGTGLGLAIARELATRMGGTLQLLPSSRGATFELRIPAALVLTAHPVV